MKQSLANINKVVGHCSFTSPRMDIGLKEIKQWHTLPKMPPEVKRAIEIGRLPKSEAAKWGNGWNDVGYHYIIRRNGDIEKGRELTEVPAANGAGNNTNTITWCYAGGMSADKTRSEDNRTPEQRSAIYVLKNMISVTLGRQVEWVGHRDLPGVTKDCPGFDVKTQL